MECLAGIPGLTGGSPIQNIGAYGQEVSETISTVRALDLHTGTFADLPNEDCRFRYRSSLFNTSARGRYIVTAVTFRLSPERPAQPHLRRPRQSASPGRTPRRSRSTTPSARSAAPKACSSHPGDPDARSAGSFFKNPIVPTSVLEDLARTLAIDPARIPHWPAPSVGTDRASSSPPPGSSSRPASTKASPSATPASPPATPSPSSTAAEPPTPTSSPSATTSAPTVQTRFNIHLEQEPVDLGA